MTTDEKLDRVMTQNAIIVEQLDHLAKVLEVLIGQKGAERRYHAALRDGCESGNEERGDGWTD